MRPVDEFFRSLREAFSPDDRAPSASWIGLGAAVILAAVVARMLLARYRRRRAAALELGRLLRTRRVPAADARLIDRLAERIESTPLLVATHVDIFERATAET